jgi:RNA polymerase-binding protein DksA
MKKSAKKSAKKAAKLVKKAPAKKAAPKKAAPRKTAPKKAAKSRRPEAGKLKQVVKKAASKAAPKKAAKTAPKKAVKKVVARKPTAKAKPAAKPAAKVGKVAAPATSMKAKNVSQAKAVVVSSMPAQSAVKAPKPAQSKHRQLQAPDTSGRKRLNKEELRFFENLLNGKKETLIQELDYIEDNAMRLNSKDGAGDLSSHAYHLADHATETQDREQAFHLASREGRFLYYIEEALDRVRAGTFGICKRCGTLIPKARLEAVPTAKMCINCKSQQEQIVEGE